MTNQQEPARAPKDQAASSTETPESPTEVERSPSRYVMKDDIALSRVLDQFLFEHPEPTSADWRALVLAQPQFREDIADFAATYQSVQGVSEEDIRSNFFVEEQPSKSLAFAMEAALSAAAVPASAAKPAWYCVDTDGADDDWTFVRTAAQARDLIIGRDGSFDELVTPLYTRAAAVPDEREAFERAEAASDLSRDEEGDYRNPCVQSAWEGWQARATLSTPAAPAVPAATSRRPRLSFAVFDEKGAGADDRVQDYGEACFSAGWLARADLAAAPVVPEPLTDEQIEHGRRETFSTDNPFCPCDSKTMRKAVRWAERAIRAALAATPAPKREPGWNGPMLDSVQAPTSEAP